MLALLERIRQSHRVRYRGYRLMYAITPHPHLRSVAITILRLVRGSVPPLPPEANTLFAGVDPSRVISELRTAGIATGLALPASMVTDIVAFCRGRPALVNRVRDDWAVVDPDSESNPRPDGIIYAYQNIYRECALVRRIVHDPLLIAVARGYLGCKPRFVGCQIWWSYPHRDPAGAPLPHHFYEFHYDMDDYRFLKAFFYLTDVDADCGPHVVIRGTQRRRDAFERAHKYMSDEAVAARFGARAMALTGPAGTGFCEDTFAYHKGANPHRRRLALQVEYAISDWGQQSDDYL